MKINVAKNSEILGKVAAEHCAEILNKAIAQKGNARLLVSTGASQLDMLKNIVLQKVDWSKVEMFHLDEYINLPETHPASFRKYLKERFTSLVNFKAAYFVDGDGDIQKNIRELSEKVRKEPIDLGLVGVGENSHIAFNDPPADFDTKEAYIVVNLDDKCKMQQVREGWFQSVDDVPKQAISMSVHQIMQCNTIISFVPYRAKATAVKQMIENNLTNMIPATMLKTHKDITLYLDEESASLVDEAALKQYF